eukprot:TRINITY_DN73932_c0_g1_i1.p1 TRINITY_DN73932_c0_g1~~TRINITY_DN73932_c0_g1_i1.p1  ORF type:complete len:381 (+),score=69.44 TRINITY_DN73932_c0_g1_i1:82-1224(+)
MRTLVVHWPDLAALIPQGADFHSKEKRSKLFEAIDVDGKGILFQANVLRYIRRLLPTLSGIQDTSPLLSRAWRTTVTEVKPVAAIGFSWMDRNQFRVLLVYIWHYLKIWEMLVQPSMQATMEAKGFVSLPVFEAALPIMSEWGFDEAQAWSADISVAWERLTNGSGVMSMGEFADRVVAGALPNLASADEEEERRMAARLLERTHPHLLQAENPQGVRGRRRNRQIPPPGQNCPPASIAAAHPPERSWATQYMSDFEPPSRSEATSVVNSVAPSRVSRAQSQALTRASTPPKRFDIGDSLVHGSRAANQTAARMRSSRSLPEANMSLRQLDRDALQRKLQSHVEMSSTHNMRRLLQAAGGMMMSPSRPSDKAVASKQTRF